MMLRGITRHGRLQLLAVAEARATMTINSTTATLAGSERQAHLWRYGQRLGLSSAGGTKGTREEAMTAVLKAKVEASKAVVQDISGGCGSMYKIEIESPLFRGKGLVAQHRMVKDALKAEIADMHGLTLHTRPSPE